MPCSVPRCMPPWLRPNGNLPDASTLSSATIAWPGSGRIESSASPLLAAPQAHREADHPGDRRSAVDHPEEALLPEVRPLA